MSDRPILFSEPMILALLAGRKTQTRRLVKPQPRPEVTTVLREHNCGAGRSNRWGWFSRDLTDTDLRNHGLYDPRYNHGDRLWVRETHKIVPASAYRMSEGVQQTICTLDPGMAAIYRAGWDRSIPAWRSSIHMPRWASRLTLTVTDVRVQRLADISEEDAWDEGIRPSPDGCCRAGYGEDTAHETCSEAYADLWDHIHEDGAWDANPCVTATTFTVQRANIDAVPA